jgi:hypothetical protein
LILGIFLLFNICAGSLVGALDVLTLTSKLGVLGDELSTSFAIKTPTPTTTATITIPIIHPISLPFG